MKRERERVMKRRKRTKKMGYECGCGLQQSVQTRNKRTNAHARRESEKGKSMGGKREYSSTGVRRKRNNR